MTLKWRSKRTLGQGLVEFALVLPLLLLLLLGMAEFARIFAIYSNLFNAAREGARYGIVYPSDAAGILYAARQKVSLVNVTNVAFSIVYDRGPGTPTFTDSTSLRDGDRVVVNAYYDVEPMLPLLRPLLQNLYVDTTSARTIARLGGLPPAAPGPGLPGTGAATLIKTANPASVPESGGNVTFSIVINNTGEQDVTLDSLVDSVYGDLNGRGDCETGGTIPVGGSYSCSFTESLSSPTLADHVNVVTATMLDAYLATVEESDTAVVTFTDEPGTISILKIANPSSVPETGGNVAFSFEVRNTGAETVTLTSLTDSAFGDLNGRGSCSTGGTIPAGGSYTCATTELVSGIGESRHMNRAIAVASDNEGNVVEAASSTATVLFTLSANPIRITIPLMGGDPTLRGTAHPGETVTLRDLQDTTLSMSTVVGGDGSFSFNVSGGLKGGHVMVVEGYGREDWALVEIVATPTPAPTPTPLPMDISLDPVCGPAGEDVALTVFGYDWPAVNVRIEHSFGGVSETLITLPWDAHETFFTIGVLTITNALTGSHVIQSYEDVGNGQWAPQDNEIVTVPCPPGPGYPDLVVQDVAVGSSGPISTYVPITFTVTIANTGATTATHVFWTDLYLDPVSPISPTNPALPAGQDYMAIAPLGVGQVATAVLELPDGISVSGTHTVSVMADTWHQVSESDEMDNLSQPTTMTIVSRAVFPGLTPTPTPLPGGKGSVSGSTWLYLDGILAPQGRVLVSVYTADGDLVAQGYSDRSGQYLLDSVPAGTFNMFAELYVDGELYLDILTNVEVKNNQLTPYQALLLH
jgi:Flp pilus assembly protein TadG